MSDNDWRRFGAIDPYFGVLSNGEDGRGGSTRIPRVGRDSRRAVVLGVPSRRGLVYLEQMLDHLENGGVGAVHVVYSQNTTAWKRTLNWI